MTMPVDLDYRNGIVLDKVAGFDVNEEFIREAVKEAGPNILRLAMIQNTGDKELEAMVVTKKAIRGGVLYDYILSEADEQKVRQRAIEHLLKGPRAPPPRPSKEEAFHLMDIFSDRPMKEKPGEPSFDYEEGYEELALEDYPRDVNWTGQAPPAETLADWKVLVVGAGISGIAAAIPMKKLGIPFDVVERQGGIGGTWLLNSYPGARVGMSKMCLAFAFSRY